MALSGFRPAAGTPPCPAPHASNRCLNIQTTTIPIRGQALKQYSVMQRIMHP
jgi:hypothetical protein